MPRKTGLELTVRELAGRLGCPFAGDGDARLTGVGSLEGAKPGDLVFLAHPKHRAGSRREPGVGGRHPRGRGLRAHPGHQGPGPAPGLCPGGRALLRAGAARAGRPSPGRRRALGEDRPGRLDRAPGLDRRRTPRSGRASSSIPSSPFTRASGSARARSSTPAPASARGRTSAGASSSTTGSSSARTDSASSRRADGRRIKIPQVGRVVVEDDVEIGSNSAVDRAALDATIIRKGAKIDDLVMVGHNVEIGENAILVAQVGVSGSSSVGRDAILSGQVGIADHVAIGDGAVVAAKSASPRTFRPGRWSPGSLTSTSASGGSSGPPPPASTTSSRRSRG